LDLRIMDDAEPLSRTDLRGMVGQVRAIAAVHDFLSHHQAAMTVSAREVVKRLVPMVQQTTGLTATWQADDTTLSVQQGTALALILNELLSNAGKHGAQRAQVTLRCSPAGCLLEVGDNGPGFPSEFDLEMHAHQGLSLVVTLAERDLQGRIHIENDATGGCVHITFPASPKG
jgi:two-component sensor histidine kinase